MGTRGEEGLFGEGLLASSPDEMTADELRRTLHHLQIETRALREALDRTARHAHDADPSTSHVADFDRCPHPVCRQARAMLPAGREAGIPEPKDVRRPGTVDRRPRLRADEEAADLEGLGGVAEASGFERQDDEDVEPSWIPLDRSPEPPQRRPAPRPEEAPPTAAPAEASPGGAPPPAERERPAAAEPGEPPRPWATPMPPAPGREEPANPGPPDGPAGEPGGEEPSIPSHLFDAPPKEPSTSGTPPLLDHAEEPDASPVVPRHVPPDKDAGIADAAADAIDRLARALFGPKRRR